ncbi:hypothetical protein H0H93_003981 [Arthromyces matolae]|nr:hypothetical protein H0H93_003981 [Arthromyces matolae]
MSLAPTKNIVDLIAFSKNIEQISIPPYPFSVQKADSIPQIENPRLEFYHSLYTVRGRFPRIEEVPTVLDTTSRRPSVAYLNVSELHQLALDDIPIR